MNARSGVLDVVPDREAIARYGLTVREVLDVVESSIGGMDVATTYEGRERYKVNVRYPRELRDNVEALRSVLVPITPFSPRPLPRGTGSAGMGGAPGSQSTPMPTAIMGGGMKRGGMSGASTGLSGGEMGGAMSGGMGGPNALVTKDAGNGARAAFVPLGQLAKIETVMGPPMIKSEMGSITGWTYVDIDTNDVGGYVSAAKEMVAREIQIPTGYFLKWTGQYELLERVRARMAWMLPITIGIVF